MKRFALWEIKRMMSILEMDDLENYNQLRNYLEKGKYYEFLRWFCDNALRDDERY